MGTVGQICLTYPLICLKQINSFKDKSATMDIVAVRFVIKDEASLEMVTN